MLLAIREDMFALRIILGLILRPIGLPITKGSRPKRSKIVAEK
jgi:hypothetical protein